MTDWEGKKTDVLMRLRRVEGQIRGIHAMVDDEADCEKVVQQLSAARKALDKVFFKTVACALERAVMADSENTAEIEKYTELLSRYG